MLEDTGRAVQPRTGVGHLHAPGLLSWEFQGNGRALLAISRMSVGSAMTPGVFIVTLLALGLPSSPTELTKLSSQLEEEVHSMGKRRPLRLLGQLLL